MMTKRKLIKAAGAGALTAGLGLSGCGAAGGGTAHVKFRVIARARLDGEDYEGSTVNVMRARYTSNSLSRMMMSRTLKMEATVVDFGGKADALFVLLTDYLLVLGDAWGIPVGGDADETTIPQLRDVSGTQAIPRRHKINPRRAFANYPKIAAFRDEADPTSVYEVDPDNLAKTHGPGAAFLGLSIEIVDPKTPLTEKIQQRLSWLDPQSGQTIDPLPPGGLPSGSTTFGQVVGHGAFKQE